jgi:hypothetical protein
MYCALIVFQFSFGLLPQYLVGIFYMLLLNYGILLILKMVTEALFINVSCVIDQCCSVSISHWLINSQERIRHNVLYRICVTGVLLYEMCFVIQKVAFGTSDFMLGIALHSLYVKDFAK